MNGELNELALFAGAGGGILGGMLVGFTTRCAVEIDPYCIKQLIQRQADGVLPAFPIWDDITTFDGRPWRGEIDVITGGFPCQDISAAGKRAGLSGRRSGLFFEMLRIIEEVRPKFVFAENSPHLRKNGLGTVLKGLADVGYNAAWGVLGARHVGANHERRRMWIVASDSDVRRKRSQSVNAKMATTSRINEVDRELTDAGVSRRPQSHTERVYAECAKSDGSIFGRGETRRASDSDGKTLRLEQGRRGRANWNDETVARITDWWDIPRFAGMDDRGSNRLDRIRATGNMQVPAVAALAWRVLSGCFETAD